MLVLIDIIFDYSEINWLAVHGYDDGRRVADIKFNLIKEIDNKIIDSLYEKARGQIKIRRITDGQKAPKEKSLGDKDNN